jgi:hypothetical protein
MELIMGGLISACLAYLIGEINQVQKDLKAVLIKVAVLELTMPQRKED